MGENSREPEGLLAELQNHYKTPKKEIVLFLAVVELVLIYVIKNELLLLTTKPNFLLITSYILSVEKQIT